MKFIETYIFGNRIGIIEDGPFGIRFQYDKTFPGHDLPISPIKMPYDPSKVFGHYDSMAFKGMPGIFQDSIPDGFGLRLMLEYYREKYGAVFNLTPLQKLAFVGKSGIGAIEYMPPEYDTDVGERFIELRDICDSIKKFIDGNSDEVLKELRATPSPNGARPKTNVFYNQASARMKAGRDVTDPGYEAWIVKFFESDNELTMIEHVYSTLAGNIGMSVPETRLVDVDGENHFMTKRFDRSNGHKLHQASLSGLLNKDYMEQNALSYEEYLRYTRMLTKNNADVEEAYRRMVFNVIGVNCDDHIKNFSFLMDHNGDWKISPAYDLIYSNGLASYGEHKMSINNRNKQITLNDLAQCGYSGGLEASFMRETIVSVLDGYSSIGAQLKEAGVSAERVLEMVKEIDLVCMTISKDLSHDSFPQKIKKKGLFEAVNEAKEFNKKTGYPRL